jgi:hypothetical protein
MVAVAAVAAVAVFLTAGIIFAQFGRSIEPTPVPIGGPFTLVDQETEVLVWGGFRPVSKLIGVSGS